MATGLTARAHDDRVSVVVPVRNAAVALELAIPALLAQDFPQERFEVLCVDNGSTDGSVDVLKRFGERVRILHAGRRGASAARNEGIRQARHPWIAFTDADCIADPGWLSALLRFAAGPGRSDFMGGRIVAHRPRTDVERFSERLFDQQRAIAEFRPPYAVSANLLVSRASLAAFGLFDESFLRGQDVELSFRAFFRHGATFAYVDDAVVAHLHPRTIPELWRKALQHGKASAGLTAKYAAELGDNPWKRCRDWRRYRQIAKLAARSISDEATRRRSTGARAAAARDRENLYELIVVAGKQVGFVRETVAKRLRSSDRG